MDENVVAYSIMEDDSIILFRDWCVMLMKGRTYEGDKNERG
jgi:hypothetical protein